MKLASFAACAALTLAASVPLAADDAAPDAGGALVVEVTARDGGPVAGADVSLLPDPPQFDEARLVESRFLPALAPERPVAAARADDAGRVRFADVRPAPYRVVARAAGRATAVEHAAVGPGDAAAPLRIALDPACALRGVVTGRDGASAAGVVVIAAPRVRSSDRIEPALHFRATADADGRWSLDGLPAGEYGTWTWRPRFGLVPGDVVRVPDVTTLDVAVTDGGTVRGHVRSAEDGAALAGATVELWEGSWRSGSTRFGPAVSDEDGAFEIRTGRDRCRIDVATLSCAGRAARVVDEVRLDVNAGAAAEKDFELEREAVVAGRVAGPVGPLAGAHVSAWAAGRTLWNDRETADGSATTDAEGRWRIGGLRDGRTQVDVAAPGCAPRRVAVDLRTGETASCDVTLAKSDEPAPVTIRIAGHVLRPDGSPAAAVRVWTSAYGYGATSGRWDSDTGDTVTAADGSFAISATGSPGDFAVHAQAHGCAVAVQQFAEDVVTDRTGVVLQLAALPSVRGTVRSALGANVSGARIVVGEKMTLKYGRHAVDWERTPGTRAADDGTYEAFIERYSGASSSWSGSYGDEFVVAVELPGHAPAVSAPFALPDAGRPHVADFVLDAGCTLTGTAAIAATDAPAPRVPVTLAPAPPARGDDAWPPRLAPSLGGRSTSTDADGKFAVPLLAPGRYRVAFDPPGLVDETRDVDLPTAAPLAVAFVGVRDLAGRVLGPDGSPVAGAHLVARPAAPRDWISHAATGPDGAYTFAKLPEGEYFVSVIPPDAEPDLAPIEDARVRTSAEPVVLRLAAGAALRGVLLDDDGKPVAGARATVQRAKASVYGTTVETGADGAFVVHGCAPGTCTVQFDDLQTRFEGVDTATPATLRLPGTLTIFARVEAPDGDECDVGQCEARRVEAAAGPVVVHASGRAGRSEVLFEHLAPGRYEITLDAEFYRAGEVSSCRLPPHTVVETGAKDLVLVTVAAGER